MATDDILRVELEEPKRKRQKDRPKGKVKYSENEPNLVPVFMKSDTGQQWLKKISRRVLDDFETDWEGNEQYRQRMKADFKIFAGELPAKKWPFEQCANAHVPIMIENLSRLTNRAHAELFQDWKHPFGVVRVGTTPEEDEIVDILTVHGNWQIREQMPDFRRQIGDRGLLQFFLAGDVICHSYYDSHRRQNCHEVLTCDEFVMPFSFLTVQPDLSDLPHYTKILRRYRHELQSMRGQWFGIDRVINREPPEWDDEPEMLMREALAEIHGEDIPTANKGAPYKLLQYEGYLQMPASEEEGGVKEGEERDRFMQVVIDPFTKALLSLTVYEEPGWQEKERFQRQTAELEEYRNAQMAYDQMVTSGQQQMQELQQQAAMGLADPMMASEQSMMIEQQLGQTPPPPIPEWLEGPSLETAAVAPMRKEPIRLFSHEVCIENMLGSLGLSYGRIQADYNRAADTTLSQFVDSATLGNIWSFITDNQVQFEQGFKIGPGAINKATGFSGKLSDHIMELKPAPANPQMFDFVRFMQEIGQSSIQAPDVLSGEPGKSGETYRGIAARIEQATKQLTVTTQKYARFVRQVLKNNARLNAAFLPEEEMRYLMDYKAGELRYVKIERRLYERNYDVTFESDLEYKPKAQKVAEADEVTQLALTAPVLQSNLAFQYEAIKKSLEARERQDMIEALGAPPPAPPMFGMPSMPMMPGMPAQPGQQPGNEMPPGEGGGAVTPPSPGVQSGPAPAEAPPGPGGPVNRPN